MTGSPAQGPPVLSPTAHGELNDFHTRKVSEGGDEVPLLPRNTRVLVVGNNRTKPAHIGMEGVVKKAVGLGGWHWLVLANGQELRLQRNALNVLEYGPKEDQVEMTSDEEDGGPEGHPVAEQQPSVRPKRVPKPRYPFEQDLGRGGRPETQSFHTRVDFGKLNTTALQRYREHYGLMHIGPDCSKEQLAAAVVRHLQSQDVDEVTVIMALAKKLASRSPRVASYHFKPSIRSRSFPMR